MSVKCLGAPGRLRDLARIEDHVMDLEPLVAPVSAAPDDREDGRRVEPWTPGPNDGAAAGWRERLVDDMRPTIETLDRLRERDLLD
jgi:hypothetical protein